MRSSLNFVCLAAVFLCATIQQSCAIQMQATQLSVHPRDHQTGGIFASPTGMDFERGILGMWVTNVTVSGKNFSVLIDMAAGGDLWLVLPTETSLENTTSTHVEQGEVGFTSVQLGGYNVASQAVSNMTAQMGNDLRKSGIDGMISLGFLDINGSSLAQELVANGVDPTLGQPFHYNFFAQTPEQDNFMGLLISRTDDLEDSASVSFTLNELDESYVDAFASTPHIPRFPGGNAIWSVLIDNISVDGKNITLPQSTVRGTPSGKIVAGVEMSLKSGYMPKALHDLIYPQIDVGQGTIFCYTTTTTVVVYIGGQAFPIHPMDLTNIVLNTTTNITNCIASQRVQAADDLSDLVFGQDIMRNWYTVFNFGNSVRGSSAGDPTMQLLSITNSSAAAAEVSNVRMARLSGSSAPAPAAASQDDNRPTANNRPNSGNTQKGADVVAAAADDKYTPIIVGLLGTNLLFTLILAAIGLVLCVKRGGKNGSRTRSLAPKGFKDETQPLDMYNEKRYSD